MDFFRCRAEGQARWALFFFSLPLVVALACARSSGALEKSESVEVDQEAVEVEAEGIDPLGQWKVVEFTGSIHDERVGGGIEILCDYFNTTFQPDLGSRDTYLRLLERQNDPDLGSIPPDLLDAKSAPGDGGDIFVFSFAFDNGYHSNQVLEDLGVQYHYSQLIPEAWAFAIGVWAGERVEGDIQMGGPGEGKSIFSVTGQFVSPDRLQGSWSFEQTTALPGGVSPECNTAAAGEGSWVAVRP